MNITEDGTYLIEPKVRSPHTSSSAILVNGELDGATIQLAYKGEDGGYHSYEDGQIESGSNVKLNHGMGRDIYAIVAGSGAAADFYIEVSFL